MLAAPADHAILASDPLAMRNASELARLRPELQQLPAELNNYLERQRAEGEAPSSDGTVYLASSAVVVSTLPWDDQNVYMETVRANPAFHGRPFYDCLSIDSGQEAPWYGKLVALFSHGQKVLAFVRYFIAAEPPAMRRPIADLLTRLGVVHLAWEKERRSAAPVYGVIDLSSVVKRECIVPDCRGGPSTERSRFLLNTFLWARGRY